MLLGQNLQRVAELIIRKPVALGRHHYKASLRSLKEIQKLAVAFLWRNVDVHQSDTKRQRGTILQIGIDKLRPFGRNLARKLCVTVAGQIGEDHFRPRLSRKSDLEKVYSPSAPRSRTGAGNLSPNQRIDEA